MTAMADAHHQDHQFAALPFVDNAVVTHTQRRNPSTSPLRAEPAAGVSQNRVMASTTRTRSERRISHLSRGQIGGALKNAAIIVAKKWLTQGIELQPVRGFLLGLTLWREAASGFFGLGVLAAQGGVVLTGRF